MFCMKNFVKNIWKLVLLWYIFAQGNIKQKYKKA